MKFKRKIGSNGFSYVEVIAVVAFVFVFVYLIKNVYDYSRVHSTADIGAAIDDNSPCVDRTFVEGDAGGCVTDIQDLANWKDAVSPKIKVNGSYNVATRNGIAQMQVAYSLPKSGRVEPSTWKALCSNTTTPGHPVVFTGAAKDAYNSAQCKNLLTKTPPPPPSSSCATTPPTTSYNADYSLISGSSSQPNPTVFNKTVSSGESIKSVYPQFGNYGDESASPYGYYLTTHLDFTGKYLAIKGYPDNNASDYSGVVGAGFSINNPLIADSGGFDFCMSLSNGPWANNGNSSDKDGVNMVVISWPTEGWQYGENDSFEGNPQSPAINIHAIGCNPNDSKAPNSCSLPAYGEDKWPVSVVSDGQPHLYSVRWNPSDGYNYYLDDPTLSSTGLIANSNHPTPTTPHQISLQMQDSSCVQGGTYGSALKCNTVTVEADIYWVAMYSYNGS